MSEPVLGRVFSEKLRPPYGERIEMMTAGGSYLTWNGKRWFWRGQDDPQLHEAWPPSVEGPYFEIPAEAP